MLNLLNKNTILVLCTLLSIGAVAAEPSLSGTVLVLAIAGIIGTVGLPIIRFSMSFTWNLILQPIYDKIPMHNKYARILFKVVFAPPEQVRDGQLTK